MTGLHRNMEMSIMIAGHTKFDPDWHFGIWKLKWRRKGHNIPQLVEDEDKPVKFYNWKEYLSQFYKPMKNLSKYHHFSVRADAPGVVVCKQNSIGEEVTVNVSKPSNNPNSQELPQELPAKGLEPCRQWYLYEEISQFCVSPASKEITCPKPVVPKSEVVNLTKDSAPIQGKRKQALLR